MPRTDRRSIHAAWASGDPVIVWAIILLCSLVWLGETLLRYLLPSLYSTLMMEGMFIPALAVTRPWTWLTALFLHAPTVLHVLFNMLTLWMVGPVLERMLGHWRFLGVYLVCGLGGAVGMIVWARITGDWLVAAYGASGAIFGLFGVLLVVYRRIGEDIRSLLVWIAINIAMPFVISDVAWQAHVGGLVTGVLLSWLLAGGLPLLKTRSLALRTGVFGTAVVLVLLAGAVACLRF
ncbi:rhomboid family intramembrane serine protease [uncultured Bifidobacterium sp.]|uniref:rhomboid family intramembrane serine protease n=1 Tax=uncultured Bifidobacterium sp. TaxID=165187 RepID=UPI0028DBA05C|nr:rhomboid family intramembrane serine protease [uncultured Bifidobacterium sp.]